MTHQLAPVSLGRTPAASRSGVPKAKIYQGGGGSSRAPTAVTATPRTGLSLLSNDNTNSLVVPQAQPAAVDPIAKPIQAAPEPERGPPPASTYETPFDWEFLPDTVDWLRLLRRFGGGSGGGGGGGYRGFGQVAGQCGDFFNNKENVPPGAGAEKSLSPTTESQSESPKVGYWEESPTRPRCRRDDDCVEICFDIDRIL